MPSPGIWKRDEGLPIQSESGSCQLQSSAGWAEEPVCREEYGAALTERAGEP